MGQPASLSYLCLFCIHLLVAAISFVPNNNAVCSFRLDHGGFAADDRKCALHQDKYTDRDRARLRLAGEAHHRGGSRSVDRALIQQQAHSSCPQ